MEFTFINVLLIVALVAISILLGSKIGYRKGKIHGINIGRESTREYLFSKMPKEVSSKILNEEYKRLINFLKED